MAGPAFKSDLFEQFARIGKALSSGKRLEMLEFLAQGERSVEQLAQLAGLSVANTSQHLRQLRQVGMVTARKAGLYVHYRIAGDAIVRLLATLRAVAEEHVADVDRLVRLFREGRDDLEPVPARELWLRARQGLVTVLDVRPPEEYSQGHIRGAINVPLTELKRRLRPFPAGREVVAYCRGPYCLLAYEAVKVLRKKGIKARRLEAGYPEWKSAGLPVDAP